MDGAEAKALYVKFKRPSHATDRAFTEDDVIVWYEGDQVVGLTALRASSDSGPLSWTCLRRIVRVAYSYLSTTIGSTLVARRAGM
jgi:uncharacterized protein YuzE